MAVFGATISYVLMMLSHIKLRLSRPELQSKKPIIPGMIMAQYGALFSLVSDKFFGKYPARDILMAVFGATISYVLMMLSHIKLRLSRPELPRPYKVIEYKSDINQCGQ
jgi:amino acid transporter